MKIFKYPDKSSWNTILKRPQIETSEIDLLVKGVLTDINNDGDKAISKYTNQFDKVKLDSFIVTENEKKEANNLVNDNLKDAIHFASGNIRKFHESQKCQINKVVTSEGVVCWQKSVAIEKVGLYIPGGTAPLFSTVLMLAIPANIAGCNEIILCSPPNKEGKMNPVIIYTAMISGITKIFKIGGIQAIGAMAFGTATVPKVYKIFGPGNKYVAAAKQYVAIKDVAIDIPAGPSEVLVIADESSIPSFVASDLLSQAEHMADSQVILVTNNEPLIEKVKKELDNQLSVLPRKELAFEALKNSLMILLKEKDQIIEIVNEYAPEHLIISTSDADAISEKIVNAGSIFIGEYTPESAGDYASGTNHTLPTYGYAKAYNGVNLDNYVRKITFQKISKEGLKHIGPVIEIMAEAEELFAHKNAITLRLNAIKRNENN